MSALSYQSKVAVSSLPQLSEVARRLAAWLRAGDVVALDAPLGAGKTTLARMLGEALGLQEPVTSPTFVLMHEYRSGPAPLVHADLYRLGPAGAESLADELFACIDEGRAIVLVEWAEYGRRFLDPVLTLSIDIMPHAEAPESGHRWLTLSASRPLPDLEPNP